jgi:hypothetical protein
LVLQIHLEVCPLSQVRQMRPPAFEFEKRIQRS